MKTRRNEVKTKRKKMKNRVELQGSSCGGRWRSFLLSQYAISRFNCGLWIMIFSEFRHPFLTPKRAGPGQCSHAQLIHSSTPHISHPHLFTSNSQLSRNNSALMDLIEAQLAKKRAAVESASGGTKKKYIRRGDLEKQREQEYLAEQERERKAKEVTYQ